jgi:hypothetical protein
MRSLIFFLLLLAFGCKESEKKAVEKTLAESRHSAAFNQGVDSMLMVYDELADAFVRWDSAKIPALAESLHSRLAAVTTIEANQQTASSLGLAMDQAKLISAQNSIENKRHALNSLSDHLFQFLKSAQYDRRPLYLQECPMAFNDTGSGHWVSGADTIKNPYLGLHHPKYGRGMLRCGENQDIINFTGNESSDKQGNQ